MKRISFYFLLPDELAAIANRIFGFIFSFIQTEPCLKAAYDQVFKNMNVLNKALSKDRKSQYTLRLLKKDMERDNAFISFRYLVKALSKATMLQKMRRQKKW
jgi:hypothetical protein